MTILLNENQYNELTKLLNSISDEIISMIDEAKEGWDRNENKEALQRGIYIGKLGALNSILTLFRNRADSMYRLEQNGADSRIWRFTEVLEKKTLVLDRIIEKFENNDPDALDNLKATTMFIKTLPYNLKKVLKELGTDVSS